MATITVSRVEEIRKLISLEQGISYYYAKELLDDCEFMVERLCKNCMHGRCKSCVYQKLKEKYRK